MASKGAVKTAHATSSIRARSTTSAAPSHDRKVVYKPVVDNPLTVQWPPLPQSVRHAILQQLLAVISEAKSQHGKSIADWRLDDHALRRGNIRGAGRPKGRRSQKGEGGESERTQESEQQPGDADPTRSQDDSPPPLVADLVVGINHVTRALESRIRWGRWELGDPGAAPPRTATEDTQGDSTPASPGVRKRKRKRTTSALPTSRSSSAAPPLGDHPAYAFLREPPRATCSSAAASRADGVAAPPYLLPPSDNEHAARRSWRILVNSDARRLLKPAPSSAPALLPAHPATQVEAAAAVEAIGTSETRPTKADEAPTVPLVDLVFVCKPDINPPSLVAHLPTMVAAANGVQTALDSVAKAQKTDRGEEMEARMQMDEGEVGGEKARRGARPEMPPVLLVPLDVGAERQLADALGLRRVAAIAISSLLPAAASLRSLLLSHSIQPLSTPWLVPHLLHPTLPSQSSPLPSRFAPTTIKHVKTSAPLNPRAAVQKRKEDKVAKRAAVTEVKRKKKRLASKARSAGGDGMAISDDVYVAED
ncbi:hypothetical protein BMF94_5589 [Rhodotorula taiwanensis]|uniref:Uncharacterized protein n=1 Tax=Rhodotorula taiwanensis TaxID=741276 RepID=A0A2S5B3C8_9BASI|nr:hypothetical protein BMF94_5589 [Rhodotorula taiwanensis]